MNRRYLDLDLCLSLGRGPHHYQEGQDHDGG